METTESVHVPILERAKEAMHAASDYELAQKLGVSTATMSGYRKRQSLPLQQCLKVEQESKVSLDWLILGKGNKYGVPAPYALTPNQHLTLKDLERHAWENLCFTYNLGLQEKPLNGVEVELLTLLRKAVNQEIKVRYGGGEFEEIYHRLEYRMQMFGIIEDTSSEEKINLCEEYRQSDLDSDKTMLLAGWDFLNAEQRDCVFAVIRRLARGESVVCSKPTINIQASVGQANAGNGNIENLTIQR